MRYAFMVVCLLFSFVGTPSEAKPDKRIALVIGNAKYQHASQLANPLNDASDIAASLQRIGFTVTSLPNANHERMRLAIKDFTRSAQGADFAVVFYAGHGMEIAGENWLIPVDAELQSDTAAETEAINLKTLMLAVGNTSSLGMVILDACRNNPFAANMQRTNRTRDVERGFKRVDPGNNVLVVYAARDGTTAADGTGRNSPFAQALLKHIETPGLEVVQLFRTVRDDVLKTTGGRQQPFVYGSPSATLIYFKPPIGGPTGLDEAQWRIILKAIASKEFDTVLSVQAKHALEAEAMNQFLQAFPKSPHATEAAVRLTELKKLIAAAPPVSIEEEGAWRQLAEFKAGKTFRDLSARQRLEAERTALSEFKNKYPKSRHGQEVNARLTELEALIAKDTSPSSEEAMAWIYLNSLETERTGQKTPDQKRMVFEANGLDEFIRRFPSSQHAAEARSRRERLEKQIRTALLPTTVPGSEAQLAEDENFIATLRVQPIQPLTARQRERLTAIAGKRTSLDLEIPFEYNSADIGPQALPILRALGRVLSKDEFRKSTILVGGHTDAAGNDEYNLALSERRAEAVKRLLIREFDLPATNLIAAGFGKGHLKNKSKPLADENRRVGFVNMSAR